MTVGLVPTETGTANANVTPETLPEILVVDLKNMVTPFGIREVGLIAPETEDCAFDVNDNIKNNIKNDKIFFMRFDLIN